MMSSHYVGSIALKAILRVVGTIGGALLGIWLVGDYASTPVIFLTVVFFVMAFSTYEFGRFPASQVPYAYFLVGLTMLSVATYGVADPIDVWQTGLNRALEILAGCICSLVVTTVLWPRYAREEFLEAGQGALKTASQLVSIDTEAYLHGTEAEVERTRQTFGQQLAVLCSLLQAGSRESTVFRARLSNYNAFLVSLTDLFHSTLDLARRRQEELPILGQVQNELALLAAAISEEFDILIAPRRRGEKLRPSRLNEAFAAFEAKATEIRDRGVFYTMPLETGMAFLGHFAALRSIRDDLNDLRAVAQGLPRFGQALPEAKPHWDFFPTIDWFWVKAGIKGGLASVISLLLLKWIHPPGPAAIPLAAWLFSVFGLPFLRAGGTGDLRAFSKYVPSSALYPRLHGPAFAYHSVSSGLRRHEFGIVLDSICVRLSDCSSPRGQFLDACDAPIPKQLCGAQSASASSISNDHRYLSRLDNRTGDRHFDWESRLAGLAAMGAAR
jgi:uncharacterized membrane protein YccC